MKCGATISPDGVISCLLKHDHDGWHKNGHVKWNFDARRDDAEEGIFQGIEQGSTVDEKKIRVEKGNERLLRKGKQVRPRKEPSSES